MVYKVVVPKFQMDLQQPMYSLHEFHFDNFVRLVQLELMVGGVFYLRELMNVLRLLYSLMFIRDYSSSPTFLC